MVKLRLSRAGRKGEATYRVVAIDSNRARDSRALEYLGYYLPHQKKLELNSERIQYWLSVGAQPSETVFDMLVREGIFPKNKKRKGSFAVKPGAKSVDRREAKAAKLAEAEAKANEPAPEPVAETPAAEEASAEAEVETTAEAAPEETAAAEETTEAASAEAETTTETETE